MNSVDEAPAEAITAEHILAEINCLSEKDRSRLLVVAGQSGDLETLLKSCNRKQRAYVAEYAATLNGARASQAAGYSQNFGVERNPFVQRAIELKLEERMKHSDLTGDYIRQYLMDILQLCPTDFFTPAPEGGGWLLEPERYASLSNEVKRLIEDVEMRTIRGVSFLAIRFVSKSAALAMAAKYTLPQKFDVAVSQVPWAELAGKLEKEGMNAVEKRLAAVEGGAT